MTDPTAMTSAQRRVLHAAEESLLWRQAQAALADGDPNAAAQAVAMGLEVAPDRFAALVEPVAQVAGPAAVAGLLARRDPERAAALLRDAERAAVHAACAEGAIPAEAAGVTWAQGQAVLAGVRREYHTSPNEAEMAGAAHRQLTWVAEARGQAAPPPGDTVEGVVTGALAAGMPEPLAVMEGVRGALGALDPYTRAVWPAEIAAWSRHHAGVVVGVGLELMDTPDGSVIVRLPAVGGAAWSAGVHQGDRVLRIEGRDIGPGRDAAAAEASLAGQPGTPVAIDVERHGNAHAFSLVREAAPEPTVSGWRRGPANSWISAVDGHEGTVLVRISAFRPETDEAFDTRLTGVTPRAVVLDLRGNAGGDVMAAANIADRFISAGTVAALVGRTIVPQVLAEGEVAWNAALPGDPLEGVAVAVLVDRDTASAAELLAGALKQRAGAVLVGEPTWGKGLSQALRRDDAVGVAWQVTTGRWTLPGGQAIEADGLQPDVVVPLSPAERFFVRIQREQREHPNAHADGSPMQYLGTVGRPELPPLSVDPQLEAALSVLDARRR